MVRFPQMSRHTVALVQRSVILNEPPRFVKFGELMKTKKHVDAQDRHASEILTAFLKDYDMSLSEFGEAVDCTKSHACGLKNGDTTPGLQLGMRIYEFTKKKAGEAGAVPVDRWAKKRRWKTKAAAKVTKARTKTKTRTKAKAAKAA